MKFLLDFVSCCGRPVTLSEDSRRREVEVAIVEEERSSGAEARRHRRRKRVRMGHQASAVTQWKPSLCAISEDNIVMEEGEKSLLELKAERVVKRKSGGGSMSKVHVRSYNRDDYGRNSVQTIIPAFAPAPFMF